MFCCAPFVLLLRKVRVNGAQGWFGSGRVDGRKNASVQDGMEGGVVEHLTNRIFGKRRVAV